MEYTLVREMLPVLPERQWQVLSCRVRGMRSKEVASRLGLSVKTVETYQKIVFRKYQVENVPELIHLCYAAGAIRYPEVSGKN